MGNILVIDDEEYMGWVIKKSFEATSYNVDLCLNGTSGIEKVQKNSYDLVFLDLRLPDIDGMEVLQRIKKINKDIMVVIITAHGSIDTAIESMKMGAFDYVTKPFDIDEILLLADKAVELLSLKREVNYLRGEKAKEINQIAIISNNQEPVIKAGALPIEILNQHENTKDPIIYFPEEGISLDKVERDLIVKALKISGQNQSKAAQLLGITRSALIYRMQKHGIN